MPRFLGGILALGYQWLVVWRSLYFMVVVPLTSSCRWRVEGGVYSDTSLSTVVPVADDRILHGFSPPPGLSFAKGERYFLHLFGVEEG